MQKRGLIIRIIPYSDSARILKCLVDGEGLKPFFIRQSKKIGSGHLQTGHYIEFTESDNSKGIASIKESRVDSALGTAFLSPEYHGVWLFTLELLNKSLQENFNIPGLTQRIELYYSHICHGTICSMPIVPLVLLSQTFGIFDPKHLGLSAPSEAISALNQLGVNAHEDATKIHYEELLEAFKNHFNIVGIESEALL